MDYTKDWVLDKPNSNDYAKQDDIKLLDTDKTVSEKHEENTMPGEKEYVYIQTPMQHSVPSNNATDLSALAILQNGGNGFGFGNRNYGIGAIIISVVAITILFILFFGRRGILDGHDGHGHNHAHLTHQHFNEFCKSKDLVSFSDLYKLEIAPKTAEKIAAFVELNDKFVEQRQINGDLRVVKDQGLIDSNIFQGLTTLGIIKANQPLAKLRTCVSDNCVEQVKVVREHREHRRDCDCENCHDRD